MIMVIDHMANDIFFLSMREFANNRLCDSGIIDPDTAPCKNLYKISISRLFAILHNHEVNMKIN